MNLLNTRILNVLIQLYSCGSLLNISALSMTWIRIHTLNELAVMYRLYFVSMFILCVLFTQFLDADYWRPVPYSYSRHGHRDRHERTNRHNGHANGHTTKSSPILKRETKKRGLKIRYEQKGDKKIEEISPNKTIFEEQGNYKITGQAPQFVVSGNYRVNNKSPKYELKGDYKMSGKIPQIEMSGNYLVTGTAPRTPQDQTFAFPSGFSGLQFQANLLMSTLAQTFSKVGAQNQTKNLTGISFAM